jgi:excinuclease UvrABC nuclease subunit
MLDRLIESGIQIYRPKYPISLRGNKTYDYWKISTLYYTC